MKDKKQWINWIFCGLSITIFLSVNIFFHLDDYQEGEFGRTDFAVFYVVGAALTGRIELSPEEIYSKHIKSFIEEYRSSPGGTKFLYSPPAALVFAPFSFLPFSTANFIWGLLNVGFFLGAYYLSLITLRLRPTRIEFSLVLIALSFSDSIRSIFATGQVNALVLFLLVLAMWGLRNKKVKISGIVLGIAAVIKIFPLIFLPYLCLKKQWAAVFSMLLTCCVLVLITLPLFGVRGYEHAVRDGIPDFVLADSYNHEKNPSVYGVMRSALQDVRPDLLPITKKEVRNIIDIAHPLFVIVSLGLLAVVVWKSKKEPLVEMSIIIVYVLLASKLIHNQYYIWTIPLLLYAVHTARAQKHWGVFTGVVASFIILFYWETLNAVIPLLWVERLIGLMGVTLLVWIYALFYRQPDGLVKSSFPPIL